MFMSYCSSCLIWISLSADELWSSLQNAWISRHLTAERCSIKSSVMKRYRWKHVCGQIIEEYENRHANDVCKRDFPLSWSIALSDAFVRWVSNQIYLPPFPSYFRLCSQCHARNNMFSLIRRNQCIVRCSIPVLRIYFSFTKQTPFFYTAAIDVENVFHEFDVYQHTEVYTSWICIQST